MPLSIEDQLAIQQLYARYNHNLDFGKAAEWSETFTPDGTFTGAGGKFAGTEQLQGFANFFAKVCLVDLNPLRIDQADLNFRFRVEEADAEESLAMIFYLHDVAVGRRRGQSEDGALVNPGVSGDHAVSLSRSQ